MTIYKKIRALDETCDKMAKVFAKFEKHAVDTNAILVTSLFPEIIKIENTLNDLEDLAYIDVHMVYDCYRDVYSSEGFAFNT